MTPREVRALLAWLEAIVHGVDLIIMTCSQNGYPHSDDTEDFRSAWNKALELTEKIEKNA